MFTCISFSIMLSILIANIFRDWVITPLQFLFCFTLLCVLPVLTTLSANYRPGVRTLRHRPATYLVNGVLLGAVTSALHFCVSFLLVAGYFCTWSADFFEGLPLWFFVRVAFEPNSRYNEFEAQRSYFWVRCLFINILVAVVSVAHVALAGSIAATTRDNARWLGTFIRSNRVIDMPLVGTGGRPSSSSSQTSSCFPERDELRSTYVEMRRFLLKEEAKKKVTTGDDDVTTTTVTETPRRATTNEESSDCVICLEPLTSHSFSAYQKLALSTSSSSSSSLSSPFADFFLGRGQRGAGKNDASSQPSGVEDEPLPALTSCRCGIGGLGIHQHCLERWREEGEGFCPCCKGEVVDYLFLNQFGFSFGDEEEEEGREEDEEKEEQEDITDLYNGVGNAGNV